MGNVTYAQLPVLSAPIDDSDTFAIFPGLGPLQQFPASALKTYLGGDSLLLDGSKTMTGPIKAADGTVDDPSITFGSGANTGFFKYAANQIGIVAGGVLIGIVSSAGILPAIASTSFNPVLTAGTPPTGATFSKVGYYSRSGNQMFFSIKIDNTVKGSGGSGPVIISGLPAAVFGVRADCAVSSWEGVTTSAAILTAWVEPGATTIEIRKQGDTSGNPLQWSDIANGFAISLSCTYLVA